MGFTRAFHILHVVNLNASHGALPRLKYAVNRKMFLSRNEFVHVFHQLITYVLPLWIQLSKEEGWDPINWFNPANIFVPVLS